MHASIIFLTIASGSEQLWSWSDPLLTIMVPSSLLKGGGEAEAPLQTRARCSLLLYLSSSSSSVSTSSSLYKRHLALFIVVALSTDSLLSDKGESVHARGRYIEYFPQTPTHFDQTWYPSPSSEAVGLCSFLFCSPWQSSCHICVEGKSDDGNRV